MNNKMKKFNKILMMTVAILLTLVLASTSVVSGIFAKYVITKSATTEVSLKAFGITLTVAGKEGLNVTKNPSNSNGTSTMSVTVNDLQLAPGETIDDVVTFTIAKDGGGPNVSKVNLKIKTAVSGVEYFNVTTDDLKKVSSENLTIAGGKYMPIIFRMSSGASSSSNTDKDILGACFNKNTTLTNTVLAQDITTGIANASLGYTKTSNTSDTVEQVIWNGGTSNTPLTVGYLSFGFKGWGTESTSVANADAIQTYLSTQSGAKLTVTYTVSLEQVVTD